MADAQAATRTVRVHYRRAGFSADPAPSTFEEALRTALAGEMGRDWRLRQLRVGDGADQALLNEMDLEAPGVFFSLHEIDPRRRLPFIKRTAEAAPFADRLVRPVPDLEDHVGSVCFGLVSGDHVALIESAGLRTAGVQNYCNALFQAAGSLAPDQAWFLHPKVQVQGTPWVRERGITAIEIRPQARLVGEAPSAAPPPARPGRRQRVAPQQEERRARGDTVLALLETLGASENDLEEWKGHMSSDLGIEAKLIFTVRRNSRGTEATLPTEAIAEAIASLEQRQNRVAVVSPDGTQRRGLTTLKATREIPADGEGLVPGAVAGHLAAALESWAARDAIDLAGG